MTTKGVHNQFNWGESRSSLDMSDAKLKKIPPGDRKHGDNEFRYNQYGVFNSSWQCGAHGLTCAHQSVIPLGFTTVPTGLNPHACCQWDSDCSPNSGDCNIDCTKAGLPHNQAQTAMNVRNLAGSYTKYCQSSMGAAGGGGGSGSGGTLVRDGCKTNPNCDNPIYRSCDIDTTNEGTDQRISATNVIFLDETSKLADMPSTDSYNSGVIQCDYDSDKFIINERDESKDPYCELNDDFYNAQNPGDDQMFNHIYTEEAGECPDYYEEIVGNDKLYDAARVSEVVLAREGLRWEGDKLFKYIPGVAGNNEYIGMAQACFEDINCHGYSVYTDDEGKTGYKYIFIPPDSPTLSPSPGSTDRRDGKCFTKKKIIRDTDELPPGELPKCETIDGHDTSLYSNYIGKDRISDQTNLYKVVKNIEGYGKKFFEVGDGSGSSSGSNYLTSKSYQSKTFSDWLTNLCSHTEYNKAYCNDNKYFCSYFESKNPALKVKGPSAKEVNICGAWANNMAGENTINPGDGDYTENKLPYSDKWGINSINHHPLTTENKYLTDSVDPIERSLQNYCDNIYDETGVNTGELNDDIDKLCGCYKRETTKAYQAFKDAASLTNTATLSEVLKSDYNHRDECWYPWCKKGSHNLLYNKYNKPFIPKDLYRPQDCSAKLSGCFNIIEQSINVDEGATVKSIIQSADGVELSNQCVVLPPAAPPSPGADSDSVPPPSPVSESQGPSSNLNMEEICNGYIYDLGCEEESSAGKTKFERKTGNSGRPPNECFTYWMDGKNTCAPAPPPHSPPPPSPPFDFFEFIDQNAAAITIIGILIFMVVFKIFIIPFFSSDEPKG
jgi:hypothetical protein